MPLNAFTPECETQKLTFTGSHNLAFGGAYNQFQTLLQVLTDAGQDTLSRSLTFH
ncbi:MAG: hypothetical protein ACR2PX_20270 [Endozoicomonas sp.]|uniref:hypothetical protein n=1 Tax=Endozoicomonas sp. TaxID=1892382 RepID=UPI003D9BBB21